MIAKEFHDEGYPFNGTQCENRWKYIRGKYIKKLDNDSDGNTGGAAYSFEYFDAIDEILGKQPNIVPKYVASSSKDPSSMISSPCSNRKSVKNSSKKRKQSSSPSSMLDFTSGSGNLSSLFNDHSDHSDDQLENEEVEKPKIGHSKSTKETTKKEPWDENVRRQERYHSEMMQMQRDTMKCFEGVMMKVIDAFDKSKT